MISFNGNTIIKPIIMVTISMMVMFVIAGMLTALKPELRISSSSINEWSKQLDTTAYIHLLGFENQYFKQAFEETERTPISLSTLFFELATSINPNDPRSLLGRELPGFSLFDGEIIVAGQGTNYTNMPIESSPPMEVLLQEREASIESLEKLDESKNINPPTMTTNGKKVVYIYTTHSRESYLPHLPEGTKVSEAYSHEANVMTVAEKLSKELENRGIGTQFEGTDITKLLSDKGLNYSKSYEVSRPVVKDAMANNRDLRYFIDIHRDSQPHKITTTKINGKDYARTIFIIGGEHAKYEQNLKMATDLHNLLEKEYPGLSRGVTKKQGEGTNGKFNQDLSENAILIEMGGPENSLEEVYRTVEAIAEIFSEYYWQAEEVNG
ncbi:stage II sporulation protein P [Schinkia azotoformans]|nr:stage II sporulation protein P [Schinkia azotoformans]MEC1640658.1 stage II sporulation protein P [Schinkia azotoformans]MEC1720188.1 stage II sporulation protein P [Schinkia azotoformans]MEC1944457.1 stage II sporulation protein P [Schinkia azotoformans]MED4353531.1 stage II sporulation protein P [Schinkia azotoformans]MED4413191.1 stage II sporulation protein P [Schinkia azotoformans]